MIYIPLTHNFRFMHSSCNFLRFKSRFRKYFCFWDVCGQAYADQSIKCHKSLSQMILQIHFNIWRHLFKETTLRKLKKIGGKYILYIKGGWKVVTLEMAININGHRGYPLKCGCKFGWSTMLDLSTFPAFFWHSKEDLEEKDWRQK